MQNHSILYKILMFDDIKNWGVFLSLCCIIFWIVEERGQLFKRRVRLLWLICSSDFWSSGGWSFWSDWTTCPTPCEGRSKSRGRYCVTQFCNGHYYEFKDCDPNDCLGLFLFCSLKSKLILIFNFFNKEFNLNSAFDVCMIFFQA